MVPLATSVAADIVRDELERASKAAMAADIARDESEQAARAVRRLAPTSFPSLPSAIARDLERRSCTVPQTYMSPDPHNVAKGSFRERGQTDWAVLCSRDLSSALLIYWGGSTERVETLKEFSPDAGWLQHIGDGKVGFSRWINATTRERILEYHATYGGPEPPSIDHDGLNHAFAEKASTILYWHDGTWLSLQGAD